MTKAGDRILASARNARAFVRGEDVPGTTVHIPKEIDTKRMRGAQGLTQEKFAARYGFSVGAVRDWEQGRSVPDKVTQNYLKTIDAAPDLVTSVVTGKLAGARKVSPAGVGAKTQPLRGMISGLGKRVMANAKAAPVAVVGKMKMAKAAKRQTPRRASLKA